MNEPASRWAAERSDHRGADYDERWRLMAAAGESVHGEADFVGRYDPTTVFDAGCGTGRVAIELARRGVDVVGVDLDPVMLEQARSNAPELTWIEASVEDVDLGRHFDVVLTAGNVLIFVRPGTQSGVVANLARHVTPDGVLISGFQLGQGYEHTAYAMDCAAAGLVAVGRFAGWNGEPWVDDGDYLVSVHRRPGR